MTAPARRYSWPPFEPGNVAAQTHGAYSERRWRPLAEQLEQHLTTSAPWTQGAAFAATRADWARTEAQLHLVATWLDENGLLTDDGEPREATNLQARLSTASARLRGELGLSPLAMAKLLGALSAVDGPAAREGLEALKAAGREIRQGATQAALPGGEPDAA